MSTLRLFNEGDLRQGTSRGGTIRSESLLGLADFAIQRGLAPARVENLIGVSLPCARRGVHLPAISGQILFAHVLDLGLCEAPALDLGRRVPFTFLAGLERGVSLAPTGRAAIDALAEHFAVFHNQLVPEVDGSRSFTRFSFRFHGAEFDNGCCNELVLSVLVRLFRAVLGRRGQPREVQSRFDLNGSRSAYERFFRCPIRTRSEDRGYGIVWKSEDLTRSPRGHHPEAFAAELARLSPLASVRRNRSAADDFYELVNSANVCVNDGIFGVSEVVAHAGLGERTAQRITRDRGSSVGKLIDQARLRLLREQVARSPARGAEDLSASVGFSDSRALRRALKAWTGLQISQFRKTPFGYDADSGRAAAS